VNLDTLVRRGERPWLPLPDATDLDVWMEYGHPRIGTFRVGPDLVMFATAYDVDDDRLSVWAYVPVPRELEALTSEVEFATSGELRTFISKMFAGRQAVFAIADNDAVARWSTRDVNNDEEGLTSAAADFLDSLLQAIPLRSPAARLRAAVKAAEARDLMNA
jgi:hypothetical protein